MKGSKGHWAQLADGCVWVDTRRFRLMSFDQPLAPWRGSLDEVHRDAVDRGAGSFSDGGTFFISVPCWIKESGMTAETEAGLKRRLPRKLVEVSADRRSRQRQA